LVDLLRLDFWDEFYLHFSSFSNISIFFEGIVVLELFWINMRAKNMNSHDFLIKMTRKIGLYRAPTGNMGELHHFIIYFECIRFVCTN